MFSASDYYFVNSSSYFIEMKISYNWIKTLIKIDLSPEQVAEHLTACGLEVESIEKFESIKGGLKGIVIGEVVEKTKHPDADKLSLTKVNVGKDELLNIVCGAPNVAAGQKVIVATIGSVLHPITGDSFEIKKSKIRGALSEGMLCAEDEIGLGVSHAGIMVLDEHAIVGSNAADYFKISEDYVFEIGLTPNRGDAASHYGVAIDLAAVLNLNANELVHNVRIPAVEDLDNSFQSLPISVSVGDSKSCPRYSGITISGVQVKESPDWLKNALKAIGVRPINNIVDITNYVLHELGQPLHAFDAAKIKGNKVVVRKARNEEKFVTLDGVERTLSNTDLMICDEKDPMCIAGVFGGLHSGVSETTTSIFLESAYFSPSSIRKSSKQHGLKTDASFRFERGTDPEITVIALSRVVKLILEVAGGEVTGSLIDHYPIKLDEEQIVFSFDRADQLIGKKIDHKKIKIILESLGIHVLQEGKDALLLKVPVRKSDVTREADVIEEIMRVYGYNNIEVSDKTSFSVSYALKKEVYKTEEIIADFLSANGFTEIMSTSLTKENYFDDKTNLVNVLNPLSTDLSVMRTSLLYSGLEAVAYNCNRKNSDLLLFEIGRTYSKQDGLDFKYAEQKQLALFVSGKRFPLNHFGANEKTDFFTLKAITEKILQRFNLTSYTIKEAEHTESEFCLEYYIGKKLITSISKINKTTLKKCDVQQDVYSAIFYTEQLTNLYNPDKLKYKEVPKFPSVRRDLALLLDKSIKYDQVKEVAEKTERKLLKAVNLFDVYESEKTGNKKSYAVSFIFQDEQNTLTDKDITKTMDKLIKAYNEQLGAEIR